ncbi:hypothetical protein CVO74_14725 [Xanthomonas prunicola]|uniref:Uncharacterized protein n=1 Tax=Xanthomonas prunicola TaxID=2053930 RepID=A0A2N3RIU6_9XANT|nr:hypothetical protein XpruCFBP8353_10790 [Xanthomonas prunicola]PKV16690.1 hypothetical protein XpruCFBP8354_10790 [Xanthomonas prunicola]PKV20894.1 hypothetical protein CVO74_14725 [Xanthomonas prunicola]
MPAHRRGTLGGMEAAKEPIRTDLWRVLRWWAGKGPAATLRCAVLQTHQPMTREGPKPHNRAHQPL